MAKETVRYPDALVARIETFVSDSSAFESKSEYHRFASEFLLSLLDPDHQPSVLGYGEIFDDLGDELDEVFDDATEGTEPFLETYIRVRRHLLRGEVDEARAAVDDQYGPTDREALLLDELIGRSRESGPRRATESHLDRPADADPSGVSNGHVEEREPETTGTGSTGDTATETEAESAHGMDTPPTDEQTVESEY
jgi:Arc/MetJ-type ribon-helix-helix transcriptional regulator